MNEKLKLLAKQNSCFWSSLHNIDKTATWNLSIFLWTSHLTFIINLIFIIKGLRTLKETIEDCWDQDGDARLSALCVKERFSELLKDFPDGLSSTSSFNPVQQIVQNYPVSNSQSPLGSGKLVTNSPPPIIATQLWPEKSSNQGRNMTTV